MSRLITEEILRDRTPDIQLLRRQRINSSNVQDWYLVWLYDSTEPPNPMDMAAPKPWNKTILQQPLIRKIQEIHIQNKVAARGRIHM